MSDPAPCLEIVLPEPRGTGKPIEPVAPPDERASKTAPIALAILLGVSVIFLGLQYQRGRALLGQVATLESELVAAQASLAAHRAQLGEVRSQVGSVRAAMTELEGRIAELDVSASREP